MTKVSLYVPKIEDLWFRQVCMSDHKTMNYNAGYDVHFDGYHYDTGCIDFPKEKWQSWYEEKMLNPNFFYAYIVNEKKQFVGYVNFNKNSETNIATMGIVIKDEYRGNGYMRPALLLLIDEAKKRGVKKLTDTVPESRENALKLFYNLQFSKTNLIIGKKFNQEEAIAEIELKL